MTSKTLTTSNKRMIRRALEDYAKQLREIYPEKFNNTTGKINTVQRLHNEALLIARYKLTAKYRLAQSDISKATGGAMNCPIARMLRRNGYPCAIVGNLYWRKHPMDNRIMHTPSQRLIVRKFDTNKPIHPCIILVNMP